jgi:hypothetical protein
VGYVIRCNGGHRVMVLPGAENELMPLALRRHPDMINGSLGDAYHANDAAGAARFRAAGALVAIAHTEQRTIEQLREIAPDLIEVYNVHANLDPRIVPMASPSLNLGQALASVIQFTGRENPNEPDLVFLAFFSENTNDLGKWAQLWDEGVRMPGIAASDAHENTFATLMNDGERGDSYRRVFRWFSNTVLVRGALTRSSVIEAVSQARSYVTFEAFGTPAGFSWTARTRDNAEHEMGSSVRAADMPVLVMHVPTLYAPLPGIAAPRLSARVYRAEGNRWTMQQQWDITNQTELRYTPIQAGAYRAEVRIVPEHARMYLPGFDSLVREVPWIYSNPIRVQ